MSVILGSVLLGVLKCVQLQDPHQPEKTSFALHPHTAPTTAWVFVYNYRCCFPNE